MNVGLLPEQPESNDNPVPLSSLERQYREKRIQLARAQGHHGRPSLLVDILCQVFYHLIFVSVFWRSNW